MESKDGRSAAVKSYPREDYGLKVKHHEAESLSLSTFDRQQDGMVFNPYNPGDQLGVFENTGIDSHWRLTLRAMPVNPLDSVPQWDKLRDIVFRVWYHAAYQRQEGFKLANAVEASALKRASTKSAQISFYRDYYDEFTTLVGDVDPADPVALAAVRGFSDETHGDTGGWIAFAVDAAMIPIEGHKIAAMVLVFEARDPATFPNFIWRLRYGDDGPEFTGDSVGDILGALAESMSQPPAAGFRGLDPHATWHFKLARADNPLLELAPIVDVQLIFEFEPI